MKPATTNNAINIKNKRASFDYEFIDTYTAGIVLTGTEIKSIRQGKASLVDTYCFFHAARRDRKLLLTKKELRKLERTSEEPGFTIVPVRLYINEKGLAKVVIALAKGKKQFDKRQTLKEKEDKRMMDRMFKH